MVWCTNLDDASSAYAAVMRSDWFKCFTSFAKPTVLVYSDNSSDNDSDNDNEICNDNSDDYASDDDIDRESDSEFGDDCDNDC